MKIKHRKTTTIICGYCRGSGHMQRYRCPVCDPDGYLDDMLRDDRQATRRPVPKPLREAVGAAEIT